MLTTAAPKVSRTLSLFTLAMINVAAIGSVKNWPVTAEYGFASLFFLLLSAIIFFLPVALVSAELATGWPKAGGVFVWVKEAFGHRTGFLAIWLLWIENVIWYPTALSFIAATFAYIIDPALVENKVYLASSILILFWGITLLNFLGMRTSGWISTVGAVCGTFIPGVLIIVLGAFWYFGGNPLQISFSWEALIPDMTSPGRVVFFVGVLLSLAGLEMSAIHARDVKNPQKNYPKAILLSAAMIVGLSLLGVLAIAVVIPQSEISLTAGALQAFSFFMNAYGLNILVPLIAALIGIGTIGSMSTWVVGPTKGLLAAARSGDLPPFFRKINARGMPVMLMLVQAVIVSFLSFFFVFMENINIAYWILVALVTQFYLIMYGLMFASAIKLRYKRPEVERPYKIPGKNIGMWCMGILGILSSLLAFVIGFFPPSQLATSSQPLYILSMLGGVILICFVPAIILRFKKPHWNHLLEHEKE